MTPGPVVVKVSGSLYDLPDLGSRLQRWLDRSECHAAVLVPGGGPTADVVRELDRRHGLGEEASHWLALQALSLNAAFLARLLPSAAVASEPREWAELWRQGRMPVLDAYRFALVDEGRPGCLPHCWEATSDAVAARVAAVIKARRLVLLKSVSMPLGMSWAEAARLGLVDACFARTVEGMPSIEVRAINLRAWQP